ncbi:hypothetical protein CY34DRAFT_805264 [Suillus luteus UH-Slu-Lm8-n1]|uniref:Unplaced genomic scaffold CY34scaffold_116, whole genome shotgun sequence n=1 Tax=Suillus luteus UH-Slu-Lm8-n1 TaxID=930992 RepID=A0A0D0B6L4_9AGAM|nr:hypothetical protein CY34DRAFT_805264 [Suillus luteus UH-Slu-Lm8-n1]
MIALTEILETCTWPVRLGPTSSHMDFREFQTLESLVHQTLGGRIPNINLSVALERAIDEWECLFYPIHAGAILPRPS